MSRPHATLIAAGPTHEIFFVMWPGLPPGGSVRAFYATRYPGSDLLYIESATRHANRHAGLSWREKNEIARAVLEADLFD